MKSDRWLMDKEVLGLSFALCTLPTPEYGYQAMATVGYPYLRSTEPHLSRDPEMSHKTPVSIEEVA